jgi:hypothetical protein
VALVLSVLATLGLVAWVRVVRKTEDIASTLIAVVVGALITLAPTALPLPRPGVTHGIGGLPAIWGLLTHPPSGR